MKDIIDEHFDKILEVSTLLFIFVFSTLALVFAHNEEVARWIEGGAVLTVIARALGTRNPTAPPVAAVVAAPVEPPPANGADAK